VKARIDRLVGDLGEGDVIPTERAGRSRRRRPCTVCSCSWCSAPTAVHALPGAHATIEKLRADGRTVVLTTGFARATQDAILAALGRQGLVPLTLCPADAGGRGRPYPDMVLTALLRTAAADDVRQVAVVGDTSYDMLTGVRAGAGLVAGVLTGAHDADALRVAGATHVLDSVAGLPGVLARPAVSGSTPSWPPTTGTSSSAPSTSPSHPAR
jgi:phosphoglycolate phosphatase-like HAD superfamily hydrolase